MDNVRYNISPCEEREVNDFINKIDTDLFVPNGTVRATERSHYDRYSFLRDETKVAVVFDTTANIVSITGRYDFAKELLDLFGSDSKSVKRSLVPAQGAAFKPDVRNAPTKQTLVSGGEPGMRAKLFVPADSLRRRSEFGPAPTVFASAKGALISTDEIYPPQTCKKRSDIAPARRNNGFDNDDRFNNRFAEVGASSEYSGDKNGNGGNGSFGGNGGNGSFGGNGGFGGKGGNGGDSDYGSVAGIGSFGGNGGNGGNGSFGGNGGAPIKRPLTSYGEFDGRQNGSFRPAISPVRPPEKKDAAENNAGISITVNGRTPSLVPRKAVISFGTDDDGKTLDGKSSAGRANVAPVGDGKRKRGRPPKQKSQADIVVPEKTTITFAQPLAQPTGQNGEQTPQKRKRGRPPKDKTAQVRQNAAGVQTKNADVKNEKADYKNGYSVKNCPLSAAESVVEYFKARGCFVSRDEDEGEGREVVAYTITDGMGQKAVLRYAPVRKTVQLQGKETKLFVEVVDRLKREIEGASDKAEKRDGRAAKAKADKVDKKAAESDAKLKKRMPTAYEYLSEQARRDFSFGLNDFGVADLVLSDYSVLLVPAFRGLERFVFDLQRAEGINVKMIGQAFDKDDGGKYVLKSGYTKRINSVVYAEVLVALYTEYFAQRNFFAHSDNTDNNISRSLSDRAAAKRIFDRLLDVVEYNAKKLKEIGFKL